jgi:hypothetical protein
LIASSFQKHGALTVMLFKPRLTVLGIFEDKQAKQSQGNLNNQSPSDVIVKMFNLLQG